MDESRTVKVSKYLSKHLRHQPERIVEPGAVAHHRAVHHRGGEGGAQPQNLRQLGVGVLPSVEVERRLRRLLRAPELQVHVQGSEDPLAGIGHLVELEVVSGVVPGRLPVPQSHVGQGLVQVEMLAEECAHLVGAGETGGVACAADVTGDGVADVLVNGLALDATEGPETWSPRVVIGHLIHGEDTDWIPRARIILAQGDDRRFTPFDRFAQFQESRGRPLEDLLGEFAKEWREIVPFERMPKRLVDAFLAVEDHDFFGHRGLYFKGIARAVWANITARDFAQGGSTITQQVAKQFLGAEKSLARKAKEAIMARRLEATYSKRAILAVYLNQIYLGGGAWGVAAAAQRYFQKKLSELTLAESALIAGLAKAPTALESR